MLKSLYKFFPARESFFDNFLIRVSSKDSLNDPFEVNPSIDFYMDFFDKVGCPGYSGDPKSKHVLYNNIKAMLNHSKLKIQPLESLGIISFTEDKENLLMWSHYADQHKGFVIEFDIEHEFFSKTYSNGIDFVGSINRVLYKKKRLESLNEYLIEPYFHKSDEWLYEKEHRLLVSLDAVDRKFIFKSNKEKFINEFEIDECFLSDFDDNLIEIKDKPSGYFNYSADVLFMIYVPKDCMKSITFGCRANKSFKENATKRIKELNNDIKVFYSSVDNYDYKVNFREQ
ncbi:DUF2971 domain-containing protein [Vibrio cholerae]|nr:DUF2971 domain-containing protein [Vibrio cholerae]